MCYNNKNVPEVPAQYRRMAISQPGEKLQNTERTISYDVHPSMVAGAQRLLIELRGVIKVKAQKNTVIVTYMRIDQETLKKYIENALTLVAKAANVVWQPPQREAAQQLPTGSFTVESTPLPLKILIGLSRELTLEEMNALVLVLKSTVRIRGKQLVVTAPDFLAAERLLQTLRRILTEELGWEVDGRQPLSTLGKKKGGRKK